MNSGYAMCGSRPWPTKAPGEFITLLGGAAAAWPLAARAQQPAKIARIGFLGPAPASAYQPRVEALWAGLRDLGYVEGVIEWRWAEKVAAARQATQTIPIVFSNRADPVSVGHVASLARPSGNITGLSMLLTELSVGQ